MGTIRRSQVIKACKAWADDEYHEGDDNWTIFSDILDKCHYYAPQYKQNQPWCHTFVNCIFLLEAEPKDRDDSEKKYDAQNYLFQPSYNNLSCGCTFGAQYFRDNDSFYSAKEAEIGDIIYFGKRGEESHVGIIIDIKDGRIYTVEGNKGDMVAYGDYSVNYSKISGVGRVAFSDYYDDLDVVEEPKPTPEPTPIPEPVIIPKPDPKPEPKFETYRVHTRGGVLRLRSAPNTDSMYLIGIPNGTELKVNEVVEGEMISWNTDWAHTTYNGYTGYVSCAYLDKE